MDFPKITDAEWEVIQVLWKDSPLTYSRIIEYLKPGTKWSPKTVHTLLSRLVNKGAVGVEKDTPTYKYYPLIRETEYRKVETRSFIQKLYNGSLNLLVTNFIKDEKLSNEEIDELMRILNEKRD